MNDMHIEIVGELDDVVKHIKMDSINGVLGILISTVKRGFVIFLLNLTSLEIDVNVHVFRGALLSETSDRSQTNLQSCGHCARTF